jgi:hypothetical protein
VKNETKETKESVIRMMNGEADFGGLEWIEEEKKSWFGGEDLKSRIPNLQPDLLQFRPVLFNVIA